MEKGLLSGNGSIVLVREQLSGSEIATIIELVHRKNQITVGLKEGLKGKEGRC